MNLAVVLFLGGAVVIAWIYFWSRQRRELSETIDLDTMLRNVPAAANGDALLVSEEHGRLVFANEPARQLLKVNGGQPHLEQIAQIAEPANNFLQLLVSEGQSSFQLGSRWVEASSHRIPTGNTLRTVIVMRELASNTSNPDVLNMADAMAIINDIGETVNVTLGVEQTLQAILAIVSRSIKFDAGEITLWDEVERKLVQRGWVGDTTYLLSLTEAGGGYAYGEGISGWIAQYRKPVLISMDEDGGITPKLADNPYQSFVGVPIVLGERLIGTMELASARPRAFTSGEMALLQAVAKSVAVTIYNTDVYAQQMKRIDDIATLQESLQLDDAEPSVDKVYAGLTQRIATLLNADMCGILLYDDDREGLVIQLPVHGLPDALARTVYVPLIPESPQHDIWANQPYWVSNDVADEPLVEALGLRPTVDLAAITNTAWMPLQLAGERIGVLAVSNKRSEGGFTPRDIQNLIVLSSQTAIVIENVRLYKREKRMDDELVGLQEITNAIGALSHETEFFGEITERIARLMNIEMVGILMYDADNDRLVSQLPFHGVANVLVEDYVIELPPGSVMRELWEEESYWYSNRVQADTMVFAAGLDEIASRIGVQKTMIAVLQASGRRLGVVQVSNKRSGEDFNDSDARMLMIFATQAAAIIENARLYREAQRSAEQAQGLRRVAELAGNVLTTEETFSPVLAEIASLMGVEKVFINVLDQQKGQMITYPRWVFGAELSEPITQDIYSPGFEDSVAVSQIPYISNDVLGDDLVLPSYRQIADRMGLRTSIMVPLVFGDRTLGELGVANRREKPFMADDLEVMKVIAAQIAAALDRLLLYEATGENLNRRIEELDAISRVSNELTITLDLDRVLTVIREESIYATGADDCTVVIFTSDREDKTPRDFQIERRLGEIGDARGLADVEQEAAERETEPVLITDYEFSTMAPRPSESRSALAVPVMYLETVVGVIHLYHRTPGHFDDRAAAFMMTMAVKASLGYGNAVRYSEQLERSERLRRRVDQLNRIFELGHMFQANTNQVSILEAIAYSVQQ
ncbi:MAG: GAF domain-containing protein, partial [Chloroflexota bacterium]